MGADDYIFNESLNPVEDSEPMRQKEILYILDQNGGSYNGQIQIDASSLSNSGKWLDWREAMIEVPFVIALQSSVSLTATAYNGFQIGIKNGFYQIIDSIQVDFNNTNVVQLQPYTNFYVNWKVLTSWSDNDLIKYGGALGVYPDTSTSSNFSAAGLLNGDGMSNNVVNPAATIAYATQLGAYNSGFLKRLQSTAYPLSTAQKGYNSVAVLNTAALANQIGKSYFTDNGASTTARVYSWNMLAVIRLRDVCDFFDKVPLMKNGNFRFTINYNSSYGTITTTTTTSMINAAAPTMLSGRTNPILIASAATSNPMAAQIVTGTLTYSCGVKSTANPVASNALLSSCRLYVAAYSLQAADDTLLGESAERVIEYDDIYNYNIVAVTAGSSFNSILTNGIVNPQSLLVIPMINYASNSSAVNLVPYQSPFDTSPGQTCPLASIANFQVQLSGSNAFINNVQYDFDMFLNEMSQLNAVNGGQSTGMTSGLLGQVEWDNAFRFYVANIARRAPQNNGVPISVAVQGTNNTSVTMDYITFITFKRKISINILSGETRLV